MKNESSQPDHDGEDRLNDEDQFTADESCYSVDVPLPDPLEKNQFTVDESCYSLEVPSSGPAELVSVSTYDAAGTLTRRIYYDVPSRDEPIIVGPLYDELGEIIPREKPNKEDKIDPSKPN